MVLPLWRSLYSLNLMLPKEDRKAMLLRLYNDDTPLQDHSKDRFNAKLDSIEGKDNEELAEANADDEAEEEMILNGDGKDDVVGPAGGGGETNDADGDDGHEEMKAEDVLPA